MAARKLPPPTRPLPALGRSDVKTLRTGTTLYRIFRAGGEHPTAWNSVRTFGPTSSRFDPHVPPPHEQDRGVLYAAGSVPTALAEAFGQTRLIEPRRADPWLAGFRLVGPLRLLDLSGAWPTRAGASQAISSGPRVMARMWARAVYEDYALDGLWYPSSMSGAQRLRGDPPLHGFSVAIFGRAARALPRRPSLHLPLDHPALADALAVIAERYGYGLLA